ncbi:mucin-desulfating sulfatase (N-acetylglucosamine-6-sulfatase) [Lentisphaera araneosa HTCC2155]|uniref:Mucin-desulfating sulfatase (N-acetylglucosamine-6-sulfatase) n=1 Tax=Lentisphaera araneosa HTCC2155 TaxID=313628 RepID=A6DT76_9BACT|nr:sulfatase [Lentisphaera araneosa]EDM25149.1 mucin-desulfating sulfatase (N-acetylglucosamine-6-sulfatase) [Lentisphaera araneosa HTCC2155]
MKSVLFFLLCLPLLAEQKPNILFIMSDDHTSQAVGVYNSRLAKLNPTPTIDSIAQEGIIMTNAFCNNAICTPSRAAIMTGQYSAVNGVTTLGGKLDSEHQYLANEMKKAGYQTAVIGKWHLKHRPAAFDYYKVLPGQGKYFNPEFYEGKLGDTKGEKVKMEGHSSDCVADSTLHWFKNIRKKDQAFFLKFHFKAPHDMFEYAPRYESYLADTHIPEPASLWDNKNNGSIATRGYQDELINKIGTSIGRRNHRRNYAKKWAKDPDLSNKQAKSQAYQSYLKAYLRCVKGVDDNLKRVIDYLKAEGLYDNTVIIYTGDQGFMLGEHDYQDKRWAYEESMRMPFIVRYPKTIPAGSASDAIIENVDYPLTMLDYAGVARPKYMQGYSFRSILESGVESENWKKAAYYHYWMHMAHHDNPAHIAIRTKRYKLILFYGAKTDSDQAQTPPAWELYDLSKDPKESNNLYDNPEYQEIINKLKAELKDLRHKYKEDDPKFACNKVIDEFWDYSSEDRQKAIELSHAYKNYKAPLKKKKK